MKRGVQLLVPHVKVGRSRAMKRGVQLLAPDGFSRTTQTRRKHQASAAARIIHIRSQQPRLGFYQTRVRHIYY